MKKSKFDLRKFRELSVDSTYEAAEFIIEKIRNHPGIESYYGKDRAEFLYSKRYKTAVLLKYVAKISRRQFISRANKKTKHKFDIKKRITTTLCGKKHINHFLKQAQFKNYTIVTSVGSMDHESCMFFQRNDNSKIDAIFFNPNYSDLHDGVEYSKFAHKLSLSFGENINSVRAYYSSSGNVEGECTKHVWKAIFNMLCKGENAFTRRNIDLEDYTRCFTQKTYKRYFSKKLEYYSIWKNADDLLKKNGIDNLDLLNINRDIYKAIAHYFRTK